MNRPRRRRYARRRSIRRGASIVEMAVVSPLLLTMIFGIIEFGNAFMVRQILTNAAREGARVAAIQTVVDDQEIRDAVRGGMSALSGIPIEDDDIAIVHWCKDPDGNPNFTETVEVTIDYDEVTIFGSFFGDWNDLTASGAMRKEGVTEDSDPPGNGLCQ